jgi:hypothetical protein
MSLELVRQVNAQHPHLLQTNLGATCHEFTVKLIALLRSQGHEAYHVCKTAGEGQYVPPGFQPRVVKGLDGNDYTVTGISHDAIWVDGKQFDTIAQANDADHPIFYTDGSRAGQRMEGIPVWNAIASHHWRPRNPPLKDDVTPIPLPTPLPTPQPTPRPPAPPAPARLAYPGDGFFTEKIGVPLESDYREAGQRLDAGSATWFARAIWRHVGDGLTIEQSVAQSRKEWRAALGLPPLP